MRIDEQRRQIVDSLNMQYTNNELVALFNTTISAVKVAKHKGLDFSKTAEAQTDYDRMLPFFASASAPTSAELPPSSKQRSWLPTTELLPEIEWHPSEKVWVELNGEPVAVSYELVKDGQEYRPTAQPTRHPAHGDNVYSYRKGLYVEPSVPNLPNGYTPLKREKA